MKEHKSVEQFKQELADEAVIMEEAKAAEQELAEIEQRLSEYNNNIDWDRIEREREQFDSRVVDAAIKYVNAGLGNPMELNFWKDWPQPALDYPGGPVAVYEEAIRRGVTWEEVCGYSHLRYGVDYWD